MILIIIIALLVAAIVTIVTFEPKLDINYETGWLMLWYNHNQERKYINILKIKE